MCFNTHESPHLEVKRYVKGNSHCVPLYVLGLFPAQIALLLYVPINRLLTPYSCTIPYNLCWSRMAGNDHHGGDLNL